MRGFLIGLVLLMVFAVTVLSLRPGGIRRQLRFAARRFRIVLALGGIFLLGSSIIRIFFRDGAVADWGPPALALVLGGVFVVLAQDPSSTASSTHPPAGRKGDV
ncbi:MAG TPA: hypothetical protein VK256_01575 [Candidatus Eisenbacteria bacterium]|nr:hypothetical protein [Candidatus Eisenbacteria bacterium]